MQIPLCERCEYRNDALVYVLSLSLVLSLFNATAYLL